MIRVVHLITVLDVGGAERQLSNLVKGSDSRGFRHVVVSMADIGPVGAELASDGFEVCCLGMARSFPSPIGLYRLVRLLRRTKPQILHCWMYHASLLGLAVGKLVAVPRLVWGIRCSDLDFRHYRYLTRFVVGLGAPLSRHVDVIVPNSERGKKVHIAQGYDGRRMVVIANGFDPELFKPDEAARASVRRELGLSENVILVGLIARFDAMKDHETFFKAAGLLIRRLPGVHFMLAGAGVSIENAPLARMVCKNGLNGAVHLVGPRDDVPRLTAALDLGTSASIGEGFCNAIGEAMACAVPCVATDVGDAARIVADTGRVVPPRNPEALAAAWAELIETSPDQRRDLGQRARKRVEENFTVEKTVESYETLYRELASLPPE